VTSRKPVSVVRAVEREFAWLEAVMNARFAAYGERNPHAEAGFELPEAPPIEHAKGPYASLVRELELGAEARLVLILALAPYLAPERLDPFLLQNQATGRRFTEFGGLVGQSHGGFLPTAETAMFLLAGHDWGRRIALASLFGPDQPLIRRGVLIVDHRHPEEPPLSAALRLSPQGLHLLLNGSGHTPTPGPDFPATRITTNLDWDDLVLDEATRRQIDVIGLWIRHAHTLMEDWGLGRRLKPGYRSLFYGPPGTGKTLTACLLGKRHGLPVYRVDLSQVVSKWIGETEKNLAALFDQAEHSGWILFFDEADALFGKRTESHSANDRSANQQIAYLLQRLEDYAGLAILATNQHAYMDEAFARRFQSTIQFPMPDAAARLQLWRDSFSSDSASGGGFALAPDVKFESLAERHELAGGAIINVLRYACLMAVQRRPPTVHAHDLADGVRRELQKEGRYLSR
jgi:AAA+ superfamily predicted ATPase